MKRLRKNGWKMILDLIMAVVLVLLYNKRVLGMAFHEIAGLAICGLFIIHKLLNWKWIKAVTTGLFSRRTPARQKLYWVLDILLFVSFTYVLVSGIMISKIVFPSTSGGNTYKIGHYAVAALALALTGIHVGLHLSWMGQRMTFLKRLPRLLRRGLAIVLSVAVLAFGVVEFTSSSMMQWLGNLGVVFGASSAMPSEGGFQGLPEGMTVSETTSSTDTAQTDTEALAQTESTDSSVTATEADSTVTDDATAQSGYGNGGGRGQGLADGQGPHGNGNGNGGGNDASGNVGGVLLSFMSILLGFAVFTAWLDAGVRRLRRKKRLAPSTLPTDQPDSPQEQKD